MKRLFSLVVVALSIMANAATQETNGVVWTYAVHDGAAEVTSISPSVVVLDVPSSLGGFPVRWIGENAFEQCGELLSAFIPSSVEELKSRSFKECSKLERVVLNEGLITINSYAFMGCTSLVSVSLPSSLSAIGQYAFSQCESLTAVTFPEGLKYMWEGAFSECARLMSVRFLGGQTYFGDNVFRNCELLSSVMIGEGQNTIGSGAYAGCTKLRSVTLPDSLVWIGMSAFQDCSALKSITIPKGVKDFGTSSFSGCTSLSYVDFEGAPPSGLQISLLPQIATIRYNVAHQGDWTGVLNDCGLVKATPYVPTLEPLQDGGPYTNEVEGIEWVFVVKNGEASIGSGKFEGSRATISPIVGAVSVPAKLGGCPVTGVGAYAFYQYVGLANVSLPLTVKKIGTAAFCGCSTLTSFVIPSSVTKVGEHAFS